MQTGDSLQISRKSTNYIQVIMHVCPNVISTAGDTQTRSIAAAAIRSTNLIFRSSQPTKPHYPQSNQSILKFGAHGTDNEVTCFLKLK